MPTIARNKQIGHNFKILEEFEAGLALTGAEVKAAKLSQINLRGSFVSIQAGEAWIKNMHISPYKKAGLNQKNYNPEQDRKLLLKNKELDYLIGKTKERGLTIIPISVYTTRRLVKVKIALVKGKKKHDKRQVMKKRDIDREIARKLKNYQ